MTHAHRAARPAPWRVLAASLALVSAACFVMWADRSTPSADAVPGTGASDSAADGATPAPALESQPQPQPQPVRLSVAGIDVSTRLIRLGLEPDGEVEVPADPALAGWYDLGPPPGARGTSVVLGHVDSADGPGVFARLTELVRGDRVRVRLDDGSTVVYAVHTVATYANEDFPARQVYGGTGRRVLNLVTCGGAFDAARGGYQSNVVVNARWISGTRS